MAKTKFAKRQGRQKMAKKSQNLENGKQVTKFGKMAKGNKICKKVPKILKNGKKVTKFEKMAKKETKFEKMRKK